MKLGKNFFIKNISNVGMTSHWLKKKGNQYSLATKVNQGKQTQKLADRTWCTAIPYITAIPYVSSSLTH